MSRRTFLTAAAAVAAAVGLAALAVPGTLLASKGVADTAATRVWVREVGGLLLVVGATAFAVRRHPASPTLVVVLAADAAIQLALLPVEPIAWLTGVVTEPAGIVPNTVAHVVLAAAFARYARQAHLETQRETPRDVTSEFA